MSSSLSDRVQKAAAAAGILKKIDDEREQYRDRYDENAVQKLIDQKQAAEAMANLGLAGSGQSRIEETQAEAKQQNADAALRKKQKAEEDSLHQSLIEQLLKTI